MRGKNFKFNLFLTLFFILLPLMVMIPLHSHHKIPLNHDYFNHIVAIAQAKIELMRGQFPLRVMNDTHTQWFYPYYQFYSTTTYTFAGVMHWIFSPNNPFIAFKLTLICALFIGGLYTYRLCLWLFQSKTIAIVCSGLFINSVYLNILINHLGAFNEAVAVSLLPPTFFYTLQRMYWSNRPLTLLQMGLCWYLLATVHLITFVLATITMGLYLLFLSFHQTARPMTFKRNIFNTLLGYMLGGLMAMWYLGPIATFSNYLNIRHSFSNSDVFFSTTPTFASLLSPIGYLADVLQQAPQPGKHFNTIFLTHPNLGLPLVAGFFICCLILSHYRKFSTTLGVQLLPVFFALFCVLFFIIWSPFNFWQWLPENCRFMQYSWRFLGTLTLVGTLLFGVALLWLFDAKLNGQWAFGICVFIFVSNFYWYTHLQTFGHYKKEIAKIKISDNYLIDAKNNFTQFNTWIDHFILDDKILHRKPLALKNVKPLIIKTMDDTNPTEIQIIGQVANNTVLKQERLALLVNGNVISRMTLSNKPFDWTVKLGTLTFPQVSSFKVIGPEKKISFKDIPIMIDSIRLTGYINKKYVLDVADVRSHCALIKTDLICQLANIKNKFIIELPVYYYPNMLRIFLNHTQINYKSIYYGNYLIPYVKPSMGTMSLYKIQFIGLDWANYISEVFWAFWGIVLIYLLLTRLHMFFKKSP